MAMSVSGVVSGIDWESMITEVITNAAKPAQVQVQKKTNLTNKKTYFEEMKVSMQSLQSSLSALKLPSTYKAKEVTVERVDSNGSYKGVLTATVNADAAVNVYDIEVQQLAKAQVQRSNSFSGSLSGAFSGALNGVTSAKMWITVGAEKVGVDVTSSDTLTSLAKKINNTLKARSNPLGVTASVVDNRLILKSDRTGLGENTATETFKRSANSWDVLSTLSLDSSNLEPGKLVLSGDSKTWTNGTDFDVVGNQIRWREYSDHTAKAGEGYLVKYKAASGDSYTSSNITRGSADALDRGVLDFMPSHDNLTAGTATAVITDSDGMVYQYGTAFTFSGKSVVWTGANRPADGKTYTVTYNPAADEEMELSMTRSAEDAVGATFASLSGGTAVITQNNKTFVQGEDFDLVADSAGNAVVRWREEAAWSAPDLSSNYTLTVSGAGGDQTFTMSRTDTDSVDMADLGFTKAQGTMAGVAYGGLSSLDVAFAPLGTTGAGGDTKSFSFTWSQPAASRTTRSDLPLSGTELTAEYEYEGNTFTLSDGGSGILSALGLDQKDEDHYTAAQDAILVVDGSTVTRSSNYIGADYNNELITGMTLQLKGVGHVSLDVEHDVEKAVTSIQNFVEQYNSLIGWINTRSSEKQLDEDTAATVDSDDFRMRWGVLYGNSLLRDTKSRMRSIVTKDYVQTFKSRSSSEAIYGTMANNGLNGSASLRIKVGSLSAAISITPEDTLESIAAKINDTARDGDMASLHYDADGTAKDYVRASVVDEKLVIDAATDTEVSLSGSAALKALKMNYTYTGPYQIGLKTTSDDYGKSGELTFDANAFMKAMEDNPEEVQSLMLSFAGEMDTYLKSMLTSSAGGTSGTLTREIENLDSQISDINDYLKKYQERLDRKEEALRKQYAAAEERIAEISEQASSLATIISQISAQGNNSRSS